MKQQRNTDTKLKIKKVFAELINEEGFTSITVSSIARRAQINRGTFYLHYTDKYDLLKQLENDIIADLTKILLLDDAPDDSNHSLPLIPYQSIYQAILYIKENFSFFEALTGSGGDLRFVDKFKKIFKQSIDQKIGRNPDLQFSQKELPLEYADEILLASSMAIILLWVRRGAIESPEEIADIVIQAQEIAPCQLISVMI